MDIESRIRQDLINEGHSAKLVSEFLSEMGLVIVESQISGESYEDLYEYLSVELSAGWAPIELPLSNFAAEHLYGEEIDA